MAKVSVDRTERGSVRLSFKDDNGRFEVTLDAETAQKTGFALLSQATTPDPMTPDTFLQETPLVCLFHAAVQVGSLDEDLVLGFRVPNLAPVFVTLMDEQASHMLRDARQLLDTPRSMRSQRRRN